MECRDVRPLIDAYIDDELPLERALEIEAHLASCPSHPSCGELAAGRRALARAVGETLGREPAPSALRERIATRLAAEAGGQSAGRVLPLRQARRRGGVPEWLRLAAAILLSAALGAALVRYGLAPPRPELTEAEVVAGHMRGLLAGERLVDIASSDEHTVKPWFSRRLDYPPPPCPDLTAAGYTLVGGRTDFVGGKTVAALVYRHGDHLITLFAWPNKSGAESAIATDKLEGEHIAHWADDETSYWAVSDIGSGELSDFCKRIAAADESADKEKKTKQD